MAHSNRSGKSTSNNFGSDSPNYSTEAPQVVSSFRYDTRTSPQIVRDEIIAPYENDPSLVFDDLADFLRLGKIRMSNAEKLKFLAAVVKAYNLSDKCKAAINAKCLVKFGGSI